MIYISLSLYIYIYIHTQHHMIHMKHYLIPLLGSANIIKAGGSAAAGHAEPRPDTTTTNNHIKHIINKHMLFVNRGYHYYY